MSFRLKDKYLHLYTIKEVRDFIEHFFTIKKGNLCRVRYCVGRNTPFYGNESVYPEYTRFVTINKDNINDELASGLSHFYMYIYKDDMVNNGCKIDKTLTKKQKTLKFRKYATSQYEGVSYVIDIDSPPIDPNNKDVRCDFFDPEVINYFNEVTKLVAELLNKGDYKYKCVFSGNGFYFILEAFYPDKKLSIMDYVEILKYDLAEIDIKLIYMNNPIQIKAINQGWNRYYKLPFVFHRDLPRLSIPLSKNHIGNIDVKWLDKVTNISNLIKQDGDNFIIDYEIIKDIIKKSEWV